MKLSDRIWLATGTRFDVTADPLFADVLERHPIPVVNGLPVLDPCLRWSKREMFVMRGLVALQVGPTARNLSGARMASVAFGSRKASPHCSRID